MCGPVVLDEDMLSKLGSQKAGIDVRLQCWDFPGQEEYALLNQLHFSERAIYLVFLDLTGQLEDEWRQPALHSSERPQKPDRGRRGRGKGSFPEFCGRSININKNKYARTL